MAMHVSYQRSSDMYIYADNSTHQDSFPKKYYAIVVKRILLDESSFFGGVTKEIEFSQLSNDAQLTNIEKRITLSYIDKIINLFLNLFAELIPSIKLIIIGLGVIFLVYGGTDGKIISGLFSIVVAIISYIVIGSVLKSILDIFERYYLITKPEKLGFIMVDKRTSE